MTEPPPGPPAKPKAKPGPLILLVLLIVAIFAAWQVHEALFDSDPAAPRRESRQPGRVDRFADDLPGARFNQIMGSPLAEDGVTPLEGHPGGIAPPPGTAIRSRPEWYIKGNYRTERASYNVPGQLADAQAYYTQAMAQGGLAAIGVRPDPTRMTILTFSGARGLATVDLQKSRDNDRITWVRVIMHFPIGPADGDR